MGVPQVSRGDHECIDLENLRVLGGSVFLGRLDVDSDSTLRVGVVNLGDLARRQDAVLPLLFVRILHFLRIHVMVDLLNQLEPHHTVVGCFVGRERPLALIGWLAVERIDPLRIKDLVDTITGKRPSIQKTIGMGCLQWRVVTGPKSRVPHDQGSSAVRISNLQIMEYLSSTLTTSDHGNVVSRPGIRQKLWYRCAVGRGMQHPVVLRERRRDLWPPSSSNDNVARSPCGHNPGCRVLGKDREAVNDRAPGISFLWNDADDLLSVCHQVGEVACAPLHVVLKLQSSREECTQVGKADEASFLVEIIQEGKVTSRVAESRQVFQEGNLHPRPGE